MTDLSDTFIQALPDLTLVVRRDGLVLSNLGGRELGPVAAPGALGGKTLGDLWPGELGLALTRLVRRSLTGREPCEGRWPLQKTTLEARVRPQGPDRVLMVIRSAPSQATQLADTATVRTAELCGSADCTDFAQRFCEALAAAQLRECVLVLTIIHFDDLSAIDQTCGALTARALLTSALERVNAFACAARWSGRRRSLAVRLESDQLAVLIEGVSNQESALGQVRKLRATLAKAFAMGGREYRLNPITGVALYPTDGSTPEALLDCARAAVLEARRLGADATVTVHANMTGAAATALADLEQELRWAVQKEQFCLSYMPVLELSGRRTVSLSASLQWIHPVGGPVDPARFLPLLDTLDLRADLDRWMLRQGLKDLGGLHERGDSRLTLAVKLAKRSFDAATLIDDLAAAAHSGHSGTSWLDIIVDFKALAAGSVRERLRELRQRGSRIFLEDFGQDGIALARLPSLPLDGVIIASALLARVDVDPTARKTCRVAAGVATGLGLKSLALNICNRAQLDFLYECKCNLASGPLLGRPRPIDQWMTRVEGPAWDELPATEAASQ